MKGRKIVFFSLLFFVLSVTCACASKQTDVDTLTTATAVITDRTMPEQESVPVPVSNPATDPVQESVPESNVESIPASESQMESEIEPETVPATEPEPTIVQDTEPPVIEGAKDITVEMGATVSYKKGVKVTDDSGEKISLKVDNSAVNLQVPGTYEVVYSAVDSAGNYAEERITITVTATGAVTAEMVYELADSVIAEQTTPEMTDYEKAEALWKWCHREITYSYSAGSRTEIEGAYEGFRDRKGDCYIYYATYSILLTRCGIENICVAREGGTTNHWWNLVNVGDGWYHCDSSPRAKGDSFFKCFMQTDEQVAAYSAYYEANHPGHPNYYGFDGALYPERETTVIVVNEFPQ